MNEVQFFSNSEFGEVRVSEINGRIYFLGTDVATSLGYSNPRDAIVRHCNSDGVVNHDVIDSKGRTQTAKFISEGNIYRLAAKSQLPNAEKFESWIFDEVLPSIRKHGTYMTDAKIEEIISDPDTIIKLATQLKTERAEKQRLELQNQIQEAQLKLSAPKAEYFDTVLQSNSTYTTNQIAKELGMSAISLNKKLRSMGIQYLQSGQWLLSYKYQNKGYTKTRTHHYIDSLGREQTNIITVWTETGRLQIHKWMDHA
jgi:Prophage antirepressor